MNESPAAPALVAATPTKPRDRELMSLNELALRLMIWRDLDAFDAARDMIKALLGDDKSHGPAPASLAVYRRFMSGPELLDAEGPECDGFRYPAPRTEALSRLPVLLHQYPTIDDIPAGFARNNEVAGRFLVVVRADALRAFGLEVPPQPVQVPAPAPAEPAATAESVPLPLVRSASTDKPKQETALDLKPTKKRGDEWEPGDYAELLRQYEYLIGQGEKSAAAHAELAGAWCCAANSIRAFLTKARGLRKMAGAAPPSKRPA